MYGHDPATVKQAQIQLISMQEALTVCLILLLESMGLKKCFRVWFVPDISDKIIHCSSGSQFL